MFALGEVEIARAQGILDRQGQGSLPGVAVEVAVRIGQRQPEFLRHERRRDIRRQGFEFAGIQLPDNADRLQQRLAAGFGGERQEQELGEIFTEARVAGRVARG